MFTPHAWTPDAIKPPARCVWNWLAAHCCRGSGKITTALDRERRVDFSMIGIFHSSMDKVYVKRDFADMDASELARLQIDSFIPKVNMATIYGASLYLPFFLFYIALFISTGNDIFQLWNHPYDPTIPNYSKSPPYLHALRTSNFLTYKAKIDHVFVSELPSKIPSGCA